MSLIHHFPLTNNLEDKIGGLIIKDNEHALTTSTGKVGNSYANTDVSSEGCYFDIIDLPKKFSMFAWINIEQLPSAGNLFCLFGNQDDIGDFGTGLFVYISDDNLLYLQTHLGQTSIIGTTPISLYKWYHVGYTYDGTTQIMSLYLNGKLEASSKFAKIEDSSNYFYIFDNQQLGVDGCTGDSVEKINDFRIYDHCLSLKEIKELSKAKIVHYDFNEVSVPYKNLWYKSTVPFNGVYNNHSSKATTSLTDTGKFYQDCPIYKLSFSTSDATVLTSFQNDLYSHGISSSSISFESNTPKCFGILYRCLTHHDCVVRRKCIK